MKKSNSVICPSCGAENPAENKFCESCGMAMEQDKQDAKPEKKSRKKLVISITVGVLLLAAVTVAVIFFAGDKEEAKYNTKITEADKYLEDQDYEKAETAYLEAIDIDPKQEPAYIKLADTYVEQHKEGEALSILETASQELPDSKKIKAKYDEIDSSDYVQAMKAYDEFLSQDMITFEGSWDEKNGKWASSDYKFALAYISNEEVPELLVCTKDFVDYYVGHEGALFQYKDGQVKQVQQVDGVNMNLCEGDKLGYYPGTGYYMDCDEAFIIIWNIKDAGKDTNDYTQLLMWCGFDNECRPEMTGEYSLGYPGGQGSHSCSKTEFDAELKKASDNKELTPYEFFENTKENREKHLLK